MAFIGRVLMVRAEQDALFDVADERPLWPHEIALFGGACHLFPASHRMRAAHYGAAAFVVAALVVACCCVFFVDTGTDNTLPYVACSCAIPFSFFFFFFIVEILVGGSIPFG
eukprot:TRINITY_DN1683_c0_g1_i1.p2 TRINITY_DN1683_c0_g1~~TRINITY_DN1683_c0_g1_i1.p2  ORF type:complete len:112 (+),score=28.72 TRINITY_DN1683_c0_g1_i1:57-392(+)